MTLMRPRGSVVVQAASRAPPQHPHWMCAASGWGLLATSTDMATKRSLVAHVLWRSKNGVRMVNAKRTGSRHRRSRRKCAKTCWIWRYRINSFGALVKRNTEMLTKNTGQFVARWCCAKQQRKRKLHTVQKVLETTAYKIKKARM